MSAGKREIWFWQRIVSPHMAGLAAALARQGCQVTFIAEQPMSEDRARQGWTQPDLGGARLEMAPSLASVEALVAGAPPRSIHICQGIRGNGLVSAAQKALVERALRQWVIMETVDDSGWKGSIKRMAYRRLLRVRRNAIQGVLTIGHRTADWVAARGMPAGRVFPFAYFLPSAKASTEAAARAPGVYRFVFAGQLIPRKRVDWLIDALARITSHDFELAIVGTGPEEPALRALAASRVGDRVRWLGALPMAEVPPLMAQSDCLVLPSVHDGWGAVISEALMAGTPVICSDACGAAGVVRASGVGGVFPRDRNEVLEAMLKRQIESGPISETERARLATWAAALGDDAGARYLLNILDCSTSRRSRPVPPWHSLKF